MRDRTLHLISEENDLKAYQADPSGFLWAVLEVLRHTDVFAEPDFQALIERGRLAAQGQAGMADHSEDIRKTDQEERQRAFETSKPGGGPPRPVMPGESGSPMEEAQRLADLDPRAIEAAERQSEAERLGVSERSATPEVTRQTEAAEEAALGDEDEDDELDAEPADADDATDPADSTPDVVDTPEEARAETGTPTEREQAEQKASLRDLEIRSYGTAGDWRVFDPKTGRQVAKRALDAPLPAGVA
jgi:hypothetical protein